MAQFRQMFLGILKYSCLLGLASLALVQSADALLVLGHKQESTWITEALKSGELDQKTIGLMRRSILCGPDNCSVLWKRAMSWLEENCESITLAPESANDAFKFKDTRCVLKKYPDIKLTVRMRTSLDYTASLIEIRPLGLENKYDLESIPGHLILGAEIFAGFKSYMLNPDGSNR